MINRERTSDFHLPSLRKGFFPFPLLLGEDEGEVYIINRERTSDFHLPSLRKGLFSFPLLLGED